MVLWNTRIPAMKIITVTGYKGGCGKSTTALHLATYFSDKGKTLVMDSDPNRTILKWSHRGKLPFAVCDERHAAKAIPGSDYVIIDTPARPTSDDLEELAKGCDLMILPTSPDIVSLEPMLATAQDLKSLANYKALICIVPPPPSKEAENLREDLLSEGIPLFKTTIRRSSGFAKAALAGVSVRDIKDKSKIAWLDYLALGKEVEEIVHG